MSGYVLTPTAQQDLLQIRDHYWEQAGYRIARQVLTEFVGCISVPGSQSRRGAQARRLGGGSSHPVLADARLPDSVQAWNRSAANRHDRTGQSGHSTNRRQTRTLAEEQRLTDIYRKRGIDALAAELGKF